MFSSIKRLFWISIALVVPLGITWVAVAQFFESEAPRNPMLLIAAFLIPLCFLFAPVCLRKLYNELCYEKLNTLEMLAKTQKELDETKQELAEVKKNLEQMESK